MRSHVRSRRWPKGTYMRLRSAATLTALMGQNAMSMSRLGRYSKCSKSFIGHLTSGRKTTCTPELAARIAEALGVDLDVLFVPKVSGETGHSVKVGAA